MASAFYRALCCCILLSTSVLATRFSNDSMTCDRKQPPMHRGILVVENEGLLLNCYICQMVCDYHHEKCNATYPYMPPTSKKEPWYVRLGYFASNMSRTEQVAVNTTEEEKEAKPKRRQRKHRVSVAPKDRLRILALAPEFEPQDMQQAIKRAKLRTYNDKKDPALIWNFVASTGEAKRLHHEDTSRITMKKDALIIKRAKMKDEGIYDCYWRGVLRKRWAVTVVPTGSEPFRFRPHPGGPADRIMKDRRVYAANIHIFTQWSPWTKCSACIMPRDYVSYDRDGTMGKKYNTDRKQRPEDVGAVRVRVGICYVRIISVGIPTRPVNAPALARYDEGLPCRSHLLPNVMKTLRVLAYRPSEIQIERCLKRCVRSKDYIKSYSTNSSDLSVNLQIHRRITGLEDRITPFDFALKNGRFTFPFNGPFNNLLKIFPKKQPSRRLIIGKAGQPVTLICPYTGQRIAPYAWYKINASFDREPNAIFENPVDFLHLHSKSRGRIRFDSSFNIMIAALKKEDNDKWVCTHDNKVIGYIYVAYMQTLDLAEKAVFVSKIAKVIAPSLIATCLVYVSTVALLKRPDK